MKRDFFGVEYNIIDIKINKDRKTINYKKSSLKVPPNLVTIDTTGVNCISECQLSHINTNEHEKKNRKIITVRSQIL